MRLVDRYIFRETLVPLLLSLFGLMMILLTGEMLRLGELFISKNASVTTLAKLFLLILPPFLILAFPLSVLIGTIVSVSRLTADSEITAFQAGGISLWRLSRPIFLIAAAAFGVTLYLSLWQKPLMEQSMRKTALSLLQEEYSLGIEPGYFHEAIKGIMIYVESSPVPGALEGIVIQDSRDPGQTQFILAQKGHVLNDPAAGVVHFRLENGSQHSVLPEKRYRWISFRQYDFKIRIADRFQETKLEESDETIAGLREKWAATKDLSPREINRLMDFYQTYAFPFACLIFGAVGIPLGLMIKRSGRMGGFGIGIAVALFYYVLVMFGRFLATSGLLSPLPASWFPNGVMALILLTGLLLFRTTLFGKSSVFSGR